MDLSIAFDRADVRPVTRKHVPGYGGAAFQPEHVGVKNRGTHPGRNGIQQTRVNDLDTGKHLPKRRAVRRLGHTSFSLNPQDAMVLIRLNHAPLLNVGIITQHHGGQRRLSPMMGHHAGHVHIRNGVSVQDQERFVPEKGFNLFECPSGSEQRRLMRIRQMHGPLRPGTQGPPDLLSKIMEINHHLRNAVFPQQEKIPDHQRTGTQGQERLRR